MKETSYENQNDNEKITTKNINNHERKGKKINNHERHESTRKKSTILVVKRDNNISVKVHGKKFWSFKNK